MSSTQVPEIPQLPIPEQMNRLKVWVEGHRKLFEKYRGGSRLYAFSQFDFITPDPVKSPTATLGWFNQITGDIRILLNAQAVLYRDGCSVAAEALHYALMGKDEWERPVKLPFEDELSDETEPAVLLMFDPGRIFQIVRWFPHSFMELPALWEENNLAASSQTREVAGLLPSLERHYREQCGRKELDKDLFLAIEEDVLARFGGMQDWFDARGRLGSTASMYSRLGSSAQFPRVQSNGAAFAYLLRGVRQSDVLARIPRQLQRQVATWQFELYEKKWCSYHHKIMLIPEKELSTWQGMYKSSVSKGSAAGYVAVHNPEAAFQSLPEGSPRDPGSVIELGSYQV